MNAMLQMMFEPRNEVTDLQVFCVKPIYSDWQNAELIGAQAMVYVEYSEDGVQKVNLQTVESISDYDRFVDCYGDYAVNSYVQETVFDESGALMQTANGNDYQWSLHDADCVERCLSVFGEFHLGANIRLFNGFEVRDRRPEDYRRGIDIYLHQYTGDNDRMYPIRSKEDLLLCLQAPIEGAERVRLVENLHCAGCIDTSVQNTSKRRM